MANAAIVCGLIGAADGIEAINSSPIQNIVIPQLGMESSNPIENKSVIDIKNSSIFQKMFPDAPTKLTVNWDGQIIIGAQAIREKYIQALK